MTNILAENHLSFFRMCNGKKGMKEVMESKASNEQIGEKDLTDYIYDK